MPSEKNSTLETNLAGLSGLLTFLIGAGGRDFVRAYENIEGLVCETLKQGGRIFICGNGGSFADAQHFAAECTVRLKPNTEPHPLAVMALGCNGAHVTATSNDFDYDESFAREIMAYGRDGDLLICLSTSGKSESIIRAWDEATRKGLLCVLICGELEVKDDWDASIYIGTEAWWGKEQEAGHCVLEIPSKDTAQVQEVTKVILHSLAEAIMG